MVMSLRLWGGMRWEALVPMTFGEKPVFLALVSSMVTLTGAKPSLTAYNSSAAPRLDVSMRTGWPEEDSPGAETEAEAGLEAESG